MCLKSVTFLLGDFFSCDPKVILGLNSDPHFGRRAERFFESDREIRRDRSLAVDDFIDFSVRAFAELRQLRLIEVEIFHVDLAQDDSGVHRFWVFNHLMARSFSVIVFDLNIYKFAVLKLECDAPR